MSGARLALLRHGHTAWNREGRLQGIVVHAAKFPGWQNLGGLLRHLRFIREHHRRVSRIGVAVDGVLADAGPTLANAFVEAELKHFAYDRLDEAIRWAAGPFCHAFR